MTDVIGGKDYVLVSLRDARYANLKDQCAEMLNKEWKRSTGMREKSLLSSDDEFPLNVAMFDGATAPNMQVIGHARITRVLDKPDSLYLTSVIIQEQSRGQGLGKQLLKLIEEYLKPKGFRNLYLRTDSPNFYLKCGYENCDPVQEVTNVKMGARISQLNALYRGNCKRPEESKDHREKQQCSDVDSSITVPAAPPVPPAPIQKLNTCQKSLCDVVVDDCCEPSKCKFWLKKGL